MTEVLAGQSKARGGIQQTLGEGREMLTTPETLNKHRKWHRIVSV